MSKEFVATESGGGYEDSFRDSDGRKSSDRPPSPANLKPQHDPLTTPPGSMLSYKNLSYSVKTKAGPGN